MECLARELQRVNRRLKANSRQVGHKLSLIMNMVCQSHARTKPAYAMILARWHGLLTKQTYLSAFSLLQSAEF